LAGLYTSCQPPKAQDGGIARPIATRSAPATSAVATASHPTTQASTAPATATTQPVAATGPAPDLGNEVFPDAAGRVLAQAADAPVIVVPRSAWTSAGPNLNDIQVMNGIDKITVHHTAAVMNSDAWKPTAVALEGIRGFHAGTASTGRQWADIAYHYVVDRAGRVWQARQLVAQGALV
jgi:hypothetical protein